MAREGSVFDFGRPLANHDHIGNVALSCKGLQTLPPEQGATRAQGPMQLPAQGATSLNEQGHIDRLV